jgi:hypothetical protein
MLDNGENVHIHAGKLKVKLLATKCKHKLRASYAQSLLQGGEQMGFIPCYELLFISWSLNLEKSLICFGMKIEFAWSLIFSPNMFSLL